jgi:3',5'-cyclic AMP phosphodiesterase CpdA
MLMIGSAPFYAFALPLLTDTAEEKIDLEKEPWREPLPENLYIKPYLQNVTRHSIVVMWETKSPVIGHVDYGKTKSFGNTASEPKAATIHEVEIDDLDLGTTYHYRVRYGNVTLEPSTFKTAPPSGIDHCRIVVYGDARSNPKQHRKNVEQMAKLNPDIILHTGDIVAAGRVYEQWQPQHFWPLQIIVDKVPSFVTLGNHEQNASHHFNYMSLPGNEVYYSFDYANIHIISLDSNAGWTPFAPGTPQYEWLVKDLEANQDAQWLFVIFHHPLFRCHPTRGIESQRYDWHPVFEKYGVDLVLSGHDHYYFRSYPIGKVGLEPRQGILYLTSGGGGASLYPVRDRIYGAVSKSIHHIIALDIQGSRIEGRAIDSDGNEFDYFVLTQTPTPDEAYISYEIFEVERELRKQLGEMKPIRVEKPGDRVAVDAALSIPTHFELRVEGEIVWEENNTWIFPERTIPFVVNPGATLRIPIKAEAIYPNIYPIPKLSIHFSKLIGRSGSFRNNKVALDVIKVQPIQPVSIRKIHTPVAVDGQLNEPVWAAATRLADFITAQGTARPTQKFVAMLAHDGKYLYAAAELEGDPALIESGNTERDNSRILSRDEHFALSLSDGEDVYVFGVNARGVQIDQKNSDRDWNLDWLSRTVAAEKGWIAELAIPIAAFGSKLTEKNWRIGVQRGDEKKEETVALSPSFSLVSLENKLPEYQHSATEMKNLCPLMFEGIGDR